MTTSKRSIRPGNETLQAFSSDLDENILESFFDRQLKKSSLLKTALSVHQHDIVVKKQPRSYRELRMMVDNILENERRNLLIFQMVRSTRKAAPA